MQRQNTFNGAENDRFRKRLRSRRRGEGGGGGGGGLGERKGPRLRKAKVLEKEDPVIEKLPSGGAWMASRGRGPEESRQRELMRRRTRLTNGNRPETPWRNSPACGGELAKLQI